MPVPTCDLEFNMALQQGGPKVITARFLSYKSAPTSALKLSAPLIAASFTYPPSDCSTLSITDSSQLKGAALLLSDDYWYFCLQDAWPIFRDMLSGASHPAVLLLGGSSAYSEGPDIPATNPLLRKLADLAPQVRMRGRLPLPGGRCDGWWHYLDSVAFT